MAPPFVIDLLDDDDPLEMNRQVAHLFKHPHLGIDDVYDVWRSNPLSIRPNRRPWLMVADIAGRKRVKQLVKRTKTDGPGRRRTSNR